MLVLAMVLTVKLMFLFQKPTNTMMCDVQCITFHSSATEEYYLIHDSSTTFLISSISRVHDSPPFARDSVKVAVHIKNATIRDITDSVSSVIPKFTIIQCTPIGTKEFH